MEEKDENKENPDVEHLKTELKDVKKKENVIVGTYLVLMGVLNGFAEFLKNPIDNQESLELTRFLTISGLKVIDGSFDAFLGLISKGELEKMIQQRSISFKDIKDEIRSFRKSIQKNIKELEKISEDYYKSLYK